MAAISIIITTVTSCFLSFILLILFIASCSPSCRRWEFDEVGGWRSSYDSAKMELPCEDPFSGLSVEIIRGSTGIRIVLDAYSLPFPYYGVDSSKTEVSVIIEGQSTTILAERLEGGQRLQLPSEAVLLIIEALSNHRDVEVSTGRYHTTIISADFTRLYKRL